MTIQEYFGDWAKVIDLKEVDKILKKVASSNTCPLPKDIFKAFHLCSLHNLRCVILGQDPYPDFFNNKPRATGLAFANFKGTPENCYSPSLNILRESVIDFTIPHRHINFDPSLEKWEEQGVLMLNSALSCEKGKIGSHMIVWLSFIKSLLTNLSKCSYGIVYVLMGSQAQAFESCINHNLNHIIKCKHPAYFARTHTKMPSDIWSQINDILIGQNGYGIEWFKEY